MAYGIIHQFPGATREQYEASIKVLHLDGGLPAGQLSHFAGPSADGWTVVAIHDSKESLMAGIEGGFTVPPQETTFDIEFEHSA
jgi:hypothetical protein